MNWGKTPISCFMLYYLFSEMLQSVETKVEQFSYDIGMKKYNVQEQQQKISLLVKVLLIRKDLVLSSFKCVFSTY